MERLIDMEIGKFPQLNTTYNTETNYWQISSIKHNLQYGNKL